MQNGYSLRALVDKCGIPLTTLRNYRKRGIISPDVADKSGKLILYSDAQIEIAKAYRSEHPQKNDKNPDDDAGDSTPVASTTASKKTYIVNPPDSLGVKFNRLNVYLGDNGAFEVDAHFDTTNIETAYRRFVDFFLQAAADIPTLNGYDHFPHAKKLIQNVNGWENEFGDQIFFTDANESLCVDINEDFIYIFGKFNQQSTISVAEPQIDLTAETNDDAISSTDQPVELPVDVKSNISVGEEITLTQRADRIRSLQADVQRGIIQIGEELIAAKEQIGHGNWSHWLDKEFAWSERTARRFMAVAERFGKTDNVVRFQPSVLQAMLALPKGTEQEFIDAQAAAGKPVEKQSTRDVQKNVKAFKHQRAAKKLPDDDKLPTLQGLSLPLDEPNDSPPESSVTIVPETVDVLHDDRTDFPDEETDDTHAIVDRDFASDTLPFVDTIPATINASTDVVTNVVVTAAQISAVRELIVATTNSQQLRAIRISLTEILALLDDKLNEIEQEN